MHDATVISGIVAMAVQRIPLHCQLMPAAFTAPWRLACTFVTAAHEIALVMPGFGFSLGVGLAAKLLSANKAASEATNSDNKR